MFASLAVLILGLAHLVAFLVLLLVFGRKREGPGRITRVGSEQRSGDCDGAPSFALTNGVALLRAQPKNAQRRLSFGCIMYSPVMGVGLATSGTVHLVCAWLSEESVARILVLVGTGVFLVCVPLILIRAYRKLCWKQAQGVVVARDPVDEGPDHLTIAFWNHHGQRVVATTDGNFLSKDDSVTIIYNPGHPSRISVVSDEPLGFLLGGLVFAFFHVLAGGSELLWSYLASNSIGIGWIHSVFQRLLLA